MKRFPFFKFALPSLFISLLFLSGCSREASYDRVIKDQGVDPVVFFNDQLLDHDLLICDDGLHPAVAPYDFLCDYLQQNPETVDIVFLETISIKAQPAIDAFMASDAKDTMLLSPVFQESFTYFWPYETYLHLLSTVWDINHRVPEAQRIRVVGVDQPIYWEGLHSREDYNTFQASLLARDNFMYRTILKNMDYFQSGLKGIFMTNTRHAYKCIRMPGGTPYWNAGTFFHEWHPGKTYAMRFHNMILNITARKDPGENASTQGMDRMEYSWVRMDNGAWDAAFERNGNTPVAIPLKGNIFGRHPYRGNHMPDVKPGQTLLDAYDAVIFLKPLEDTKFAAEMDFFMTPDFKKELAHRVRVMNGHRLEEFLKEEDCESVEDYVEKLCVYVPERANPLVMSDE
jgi:hypothetical protein